MMLSGTPSGQHFSYVVILLLSEAVSEDEVESCSRGQGLICGGVDATPGFDSLAVARQAMTCHNLCSPAPRLGTSDEESDGRGDGRERG